MAAPPITERLKPHWLMQAPVKELVRVATTANITIATALNNGDTLDGITLATGDRVLVKDQSTASQNGIYVVGATPVRDYDLSIDDPHFGFLVTVLQGTVNAGTFWRNTNTSAPTIGSTSITFSLFSASVSFATPSIVLGSSAAGGAASTVIRSDATIAAFDATSPVTQALGDSAAVGSAAFAARRDHKHGMPTAAITTSGLTQATARLLGRTTVSTGAVEEITVGTGLSLSAGSLTATGAGATIETQDEGSTLSSTVTTLNFTGAGVTASGAGATTTVNIPGGSGGLAQSFLGYNTIGGTWTATAANRHYVKKITLATDGLLTSIDIYIRSNADATTLLTPVLTTDASGVPDHLIIRAAVASTVFQETSSGAQPGRWVAMPIGAWLTAGDYWIGFWCSSTGLDIANDGSGSDVFWTSAGQYVSGTYYNSGKTTGSVKYSIRASLLS